MSVPFELHYDLLPVLDVERLPQLVHVFRGERFAAVGFDILGGIGLEALQKRLVAPGGEGVV